MFIILILAYNVCLTLSNAYSHCFQCLFVFLFFSRTDFLITASQDGHVKFWKKKEDEGIEFVKHFRSHLGIH